MAYGDLKALYTTHRKNVNQVVLGATEKNEKTEALAAVMDQRNTKALFSIAFAVIATAVILSLLIRSSIVKPIRKVADTLKDISEGEGDLTRTITAHSKDEMGDLARYFNEEMMANINSVTTTLINNAANVNTLKEASEVGRGGEAGKGFAVVADEIRKLAVNSSEQSKTIGNVLKKIKRSHRQDNQIHRKRTC